MKLYLPDISIIKMEDRYQFVGKKGGLRLSLGAYQTLKEGVCTILERSKLMLSFRIQLEQFWRRGEELKWNEDELLTSVEMGQASLLNRKAD